MRAASESAPARLARFEPMLLSRLGRVTTEGAKPLDRNAVWAGRREGYPPRSAVTVPIFINCRDRLSSLRDLVDWLERVGCDEIYFLDNDSAFEPLLEYYRETPHTVVRMKENWGK